MRILITGHRGFVGRHFIKLLNDGTNSILGVDIKGYNYYAPDGFGGSFQKEGKDCRDFFKEATDYQYDLVIHLAAIVGGRQMIEGNPISVATDLSIDAEMFNWAVRTKQPRVVYFSSSAAYPIEKQKYLPTDERFATWVQGTLKESDINLSEIKNPDMTYGWAKLTGEMLAEYARKQGVNVHVFRPFSGYGEDQDLDYPFPSFIQRAKDIKDGKLDHFDIWSNTTRDFIHIDDIVESVMKAVDLDIQEPINLGSGVGISFTELAEKCMEIAGRNVPINLLFDKPQGVQYRVSDNSKMLKFYTPKISLQDGIKRALEA